MNDFTNTIVQNTQRNVYKIIPPKYCPFVRVVTSISTSLLSSVYAKEYREMINNIAIPQITNHNNWSIA